MDRIKVYTSSSSSFPKGSFENPYTRKEYDDIIDSDKDWPGGYVDDLGYVAGDTIITGSYFSEDSWFDSWDFFSDPWGSSSYDYGGGSSSSSNTGGGSGRPKRDGNVIYVNGGHSGSSSNNTAQNYSVQRAVEYLEKHAYPSYNSKCGYCARAVREALEAGGLSTTGHPRSAYEYKDFLPKIGFHAVEENNYVPQKGDIIVINKIEGHPNGHIAMYSGKKWISDFVQIDMWGGSAFRNNKAAHVFFRK